MGTDELTNARLLSTRWVTKLCRVPAPAEGQQQQSPEASSQSPRRSWNPREPLTTTVRYRSGPECWYEVKARGRTYRFPGHTALHDAMAVIYGGHAHLPK